MRLVATTQRVRGSCVKGPGCGATATNIQGYDFAVTDSVTRMTKSSPPPTWARGALKAA